MSIVRWNPETDLLSFPSDLLNMQRSISRMFDNFFRGGLRQDEELAAWTPALDILEDDDAYLVKVELPGVSKEHVQVVTRDNTLTIRGEKKEQQEFKGVNHHRIERAYGSFQRSFTLPTNVKSDKIEATFKDGILSINLPKAEEANAKMIEVKIK